MCGCIYTKGSKQSLQSRDSCSTKHPLSSIPVSSFIKTHLIVVFELCAFFFIRKPQQDLIYLEKRFRYLVRKQCGRSAIWKWNYTHNCNFKKARLYLESGILTTCLHWSLSVRLSRFVLKDPLGWNCVFGVSKQVFVAFLWWCRKWSSKKPFWIFVWSNHSTSSPSR